jgi:hypothetical protein
MSPNHESKSPSATDNADPKALPASTPPKTPPKSTAPVRSLNSFAEMSDMTDRHQIEAAREAAAKSRANKKLAQAKGLIPPDSTASQRFLEAQPRVDQMEIEIDPRWDEEREAKADSTVSPEAETSTPPKTPPTSTVPAPSRILSEEQESRIKPTLGTFDGDPCVWAPGEAWIFKDGAWVEADSSEVGTVGGVRSPDSVIKAFQGVPSLPPEAFSSLPGYRKRY